MDATPSRIGATAEMEVAIALMRAGKDVYLPAFAPDSRIDLLYLDETGVHRVQVKSSVLRGDVVVFQSCSNTNNVRRGYHGEVDLIGVYSPELDQVFLVPIGEAPDRAGHLRLTPARNGQTKGVRWAKDYLVERPKPSA
jgi:PD-(D/E)XK nuclease superfamily protein